MKNKFIVYLIFSLIFLLVGCSEYKYEPGRDTHAYWGKDAQYQIMSGGNKYLINFDDNTVIEPIVHKYFSKGDYVYFNGSRGYTILNFKTGNIKQDTNIESFNSEEKDIFNKNTFKILSEQEYCEFKIENFSTQKNYNFSGIKIYLGYLPNDIKTKEFLWRNRDIVVNKTIIEWFHNSYKPSIINNGDDQLKIHNAYEKELLEYLNKKIPEIKISKLTMKYAVGW